MGLLDQNYQDERLKKKVKPAIQGGGPNYLGKEEEVTVPKRWLSDPDHVVAELAYITPREKKILLDIDLYGSLNGTPNSGPGGIPSLQGDMGSVGGGSSGGGGNSGGGGGGRQDTESQYGGDYGYDSSQNVSDRDQQYGGGSTNDRPTIADVSGDTLPGSYGPVDPGVAGDWSVNKDTGELEFTPSDDTITSFSKNLQANIRANPFSILTPTSTLLGTALQTAKARDLMGLGFNLSTSYGGSDGQNVNINLDRGDGDGGLSIIENIIQQVNPLLPESVAQKYYDNLPQTDKSELSFQARYNNIRNDVNGILNSPSPLGLLAVNESPFYDFLKTRGLDRRIL